MTKAWPITLSDCHVARVPAADGPLYDPRWRMLDDGDLDLLAARLTAGRARPIPIFAYGSLIWNPGFAVGGQRRGLRTAGIAASRSRLSISAARPTGRG
ncbi:hypothetical protein ACFSYD_20855 [Paracoccus aerius]